MGRERKTSSLNSALRFWLSASKQLAKGSLSMELIERQPGIPNVSVKLLNSADNVGIRSQTMVSGKKTA